MSRVRSRDSSRLTSAAVQSASCFRAGRSTPMPASFSSSCRSSPARASSSRSRRAVFSAAVPVQSRRLARDQPSSFRASSTAWIWLAWQTSRQYRASRSADTWVSWVSSPAARAACSASSKGRAPGRVPSWMVTWSPEPVSRGTSSPTQGARAAFCVSSFSCSAWMALMRRSVPLISSATDRACPAAWGSRSLSRVRSGLAWSILLFSGALRFSTATARSASLFRSRAAFSPPLSGRVREAHTGSAKSTDGSSISTQPMLWSRFSRPSRSLPMATSRRRFILTIAISDPRPFLQ